MTPSEEVCLYERGREARASMGALALAVACFVWAVVAVGALWIVGAS